MKKLILFLVGILFLVYLVFSFLGWGDGYSAERELWGISHQLSYISSHEESTPDFEVNQVAHKYRNFIDKYSKTIYAHQAQLMLGDLYALRKNYAQARVEYQKAICSDQELSAQAEFTIAKTYEMQNNWPQALVVYKRIVQNYPTTQAGFYVPIYLIKHGESYDSALAFYQKLAGQYPKTLVEYNSLRLMAICQLNQKDWAGTVRTMGELILKYPTGTALQEAVKAINLLCVTKLHDYDMGINIYKQFIQKYPNHSADGLLKKMIKDLQLLKSKDLIIKSAPHTAKK